MGKLLLGTFAVSAGFAGMMGMGSPTKAMLNPSAVIRQQQQQELVRSNLIIQLDDSNGVEEEYARFSANTSTSK